MRQFHRGCAVAAAVAWIACWTAPVTAQHLSGVRPAFDAMNPSIKKLWIPQQQLYSQYKWRSDQYTNYARSTYQRYTDIELEGERWYDMYGNYITRGWRVYDWNQEQGVPFGSDVTKNAEYASWFSNVVINQAHSGQYNFALTIGDELRSTLTPLTFSKPGFNGVQIDFQSDKYSLTALASRVNAPVSGSTTGDTDVSGLTDFTNLFGLRGTVQLGDFVNAGATYLNVHMGSTEASQSFGNGFRGQLTSEQNQDVIKFIAIRISDDSQKLDNDGVARGAALFSEQIWTQRRDIDGEVIKEWGPEEIRPFQRGGIPQGGYWEAVGAESIELIYEIPFPHQVDRVGFDLVVSNDYRIEATSNRQLDIEGGLVFLPVARAAGNVHDNSNQRVVRFEYGLPTAREVFGFTMESQALLGIDMRGEIAFSNLYQKFPNVNFSKHEQSSQEATAFYITARKNSFPWFAYGEVFSMDDDYRTDMFILGGNRKTIDYQDRQQNRYEMVDDNDDLDRFADWSRANQKTDRNGVFPGLDANNDFRSDFNQNTNNQPDYLEAFTRYRVDPPEFLFGMDMDHNTVIDAYEDDDLPDYPYLQDHRGYNLYGGLELAPGVKFLVGRAREWLWSDDRRSSDSYAVLTIQKDHRLLGSVRVFNHFRVVKDNVVDNQLVWRDLEDKEDGIIDEFDDLLPAQDTFVNSFFVGFGYDGIHALNVENSVKYDAYFQRGDNLSELSSIGAPPDTLENSHFVGIINKADYTLEMGSGLVLQPRFKSMFRWRDPFQRSRSLFWDERMKNWTELFGLMVRYPLIQNIWFEQGTEFILFRDQLSSSTDYHETTVSAQISTAQDYLGYRMTINLGGRWNRRNQNDEVTTGGLTFLTVFAGLE